MSPRRESDWAVQEIDDTFRRVEELLPGIQDDFGAQVYFQIPGRHDREPNALEASLLLEQTAHRLAPSQSAYARQLESISRQQIIGLPGPVAARKAVRYRALLRALRYDFKRGAIRTLEETVRADLFSDQLEIAAYFVAQGFLPAAAVTAGVVLEGHLRRLAEKHGVQPATTKGSGPTAEALNQALKGPVYDLGELKQATAWIDLRNAGAHPNPRTKLTVDRVDGMIEGVRKFIERYPA